MFIFRDDMLFQNPVHLETQPMAPEYEVTAAILTAFLKIKIIEHITNPDYQAGNNPKGTGKQ